MKSNGRDLSLANVVRLRIMAISCKISNNIDSIGNMLPDGSIQSLAGVARHGIVGISCNICNNIDNIGNMVPDESVQKFVMHV